MNNDIEITKEMMEAVARAQIYRDDIIVELRRVCGKVTNDKLSELYTAILQHPDFQKVKEEVVALEELTLIDENVDTIMLYYNKLLRKAQTEGKYEVIVRILKEIRQLKAIEDEQMQFNVKITVEHPEEEDNNIDKGN